MYEDIKKLAKAIGFEDCKEIKARLVPCDPTLRRFCEHNVCGMYRSNYMCPPAEGSAETLIAQLHNYKYVLVFTKEYPCRDITDLKEYIGAQLEHERRSQTLWRSMQKLDYSKKNARVLSAGGCHLCKVCGIKTGEPCRHPDTACPSVSGYCIEVAKLSDMLGINMQGEKGGVVLYCFVLVK